MKLRCVILDDYQDVALRLADWDSLAAHVEVRSINRYIGDGRELVREIGNCEIVVAMRERTPFPASLLVQLPRLKLLVTSGMRNAAIDVAAAEKLGITVCGTASRSEPPAELTWALILGLARHVVRENAAFREGGWQTTLGMGLHGKRLGIIGLGKIGAQVARVGQAFGMTVCAWSTHLDDERAAQVGVRRVDKETLLRESDVISIHLVLGERSRGLIGAAELALMKRSALLINTSRAAIVDEDALLYALQNGLIAGAGVDVFAEEPLPAGHVLRSVPNLLATPHIGYVCDSNYQGYFSESVENIHAFLQGRPLRRLQVPGN